MTLLIYLLISFLQKLHKALLLYNDNQ